MLINRLFVFLGKTDEIDKALALWTQMQDEDVQASNDFLIELGNLLKKHDRPVPFAIPEVKKGNLLVNFRVFSSL